jgi:hypothetical protein
MQHYVAHNCAKKSLKRIELLSLLIEMGRLTYVCATCSEHFTRKYSATRHNLTLHNGRGEIVRLLEYLAGRSSGQYMPSHPSWYRGTQKWETHNYNSEFGLADSGRDMFRPGNGLQRGPNYSSIEAMNKTVILVCLVVLMKRCALRRWVF